MNAKNLKVQLGDKVKEGSVVLMLEAAGADAASPAAASASATKQPVALSRNRFDQIPPEVFLAVAVQLAIFSFALWLHGRGRLK